MNRTRISVIIPTRDRAELLGEALDSLTTQGFPRDMFEVIVVDNGSTDRTPEVCGSFERRLPGFRRVQEPRPGLHNGRHAGMRAARGEVLLYADDDIKAAPGWLEAVAEAFDDRRVALAGGRILPDYEEEPPEWFGELWARTPWGRALGHYSLLDFGEETMEVPAEYVWGCNFAIRKAVLQEVGGFHPDSFPREMLRFRGDGESGTAGEVERRGYRVLYHPGARVLHRVPASRMTVGYLYDRSFNQGVSHSYARIRRVGALRKGAALRDALAGPGRRLGRAFASALKGGRPPYRRAMEEGFFDGYRFHREEVRRDPELLAWVLREDYLE